MSLLTLAEKYGFKNLIHDNLDSSEISQIIELVEEFECNGTNGIVSEDRLESFEIDENRKRLMLR